MLIRCNDEIRAEPDELYRLVGEGFHGVDGEGVEVHLRPVRHAAQSFCGRAYPGRPARVRLDPATRYLVVLFLPRHLRNRAYPKTLRYRGLKTAPPITVNDWRERLVALAAHEACHIRQFRGGLRRSEVEAERWALRELERYRSAPSTPPEPVAVPVEPPTRAAQPARRAAAGSHGPRQLSLLVGGDAPQPRPSLTLGRRRL